MISGEVSKIFTSVEISLKFNTNERNSGKWREGPEKETFPCELHGVKLYDFEVMKTKRREGRDPQTLLLTIFLSSRGDFQTLYRAEGARKYTFTFAEL